MPRQDRLKIRHLHTLVAVAEHGSLMRAAQVLSLTQPAVSKTLAELEDIVGRRLCERTPRGVRLTAAGRLLLRHAGSGLRAIRDGLDSLAAGLDEESPALVVGALPNVAATVLPAALLRMGKAWPGVRVTVRSGSNAQLIAGLRQGELDVVIGRLAEPAQMQGLSFEQLYTETLLFVVRPGHRLARRRRLDTEVLGTQRYVLPDTGTRVREAADRFLVASGLGLTLPCVETIDLAFGRAYVLQSDAVWCVPAGAVEDDLRNGSLVALQLDTSITQGPVGLTLRVDRGVPGALQRLLTEVRISAQARVGPDAGLQALNPPRAAAAPPPG